MPTSSKSIAVGGHHAQGVLADGTGGAEQYDAPFAAVVGAGGVDCCMGFSKKNGQTFTAGETPPSQPGQ